MVRRTLADWLAYQEQLHPKLIDLGLDRLQRVLTRLDWKAFDCPVITVGGTNGKGSCVALLEAILAAEGYRVGAFTSPHLIRYNERIRVAGSEVRDDELVTAFERIEAARGDTSITFFEFNTLAALLIFATARLDAVLLEVGLGGTLDAVNVVDSDVAIVTSIALDHCDWLGGDVESIAKWKAGIFRAGKPAFFGSRSMPSTIKTEADRIGATLFRLGIDFDTEISQSDWSLQGPESLRDLPYPALMGARQFDNAATALTALHFLRDKLPLTRGAIESGLCNVRVPGRFQIATAEFDHAKGQFSPEWIFDVAHNPAAAKTLRGNLLERRCAGKTIGLVGMFADKDVDGVLDELADVAQSWIVAGISGARALSTSALAEKISRKGGLILKIAEDVPSACSFAANTASPSDRIVVFGSFHTVGPALDWFTTHVKSIPLRTQISAPPG